MSKDEALSLSCPILSSGDAGKKGIKKAPRLRGKNESEAVLIIIRHA